MALAAAGESQFDRFPVGPAGPCRGTATGRRVGHRGRAGGQLRAKVGDHLIGRFCRRLPSPTAGRPKSDLGGFQIGGRRLTTNAGILLDSPQRPAQPPQSDDLLFLFFVQDVTHIAKGIGPRVGINVLDCGLSLAGFQVTINGWFWVITEARAEKEIDFLSDFPNVAASSACRLGPA